MLSVLEVYRQRLLKTDGEPTKMDNNPKNGDDDDHDDHDECDHDDHDDDSVSRKTDVSEIDSSDHLKTTWSKKKCAEMTIA